MPLTPLHIASGEPASELSVDLVRRAVDARVVEDQRLDWKRELPQQKGLGSTDLPKDVASFGNAQGGVLVYGVAEEQGTGAADELTGVKQFDQNFERSIRQAVLNAIQPPVHNVVVHHLVDADGTAVVVVDVPRSTGAPHFVKTGDVDGGMRAPLRVGRDTKWLTEAEIADAYRRRLSDRRDAERALDEMYKNAYDPGRPSGLAWFVGVARPVTPYWHRPRRDRDRAREMVGEALAHVTKNVGQGYFGALGSVDFNPRPTMRGWVAHPHGSQSWHAAYVSIFDDGSVAVSASAGGHRAAWGTGDIVQPHEVDSKTLESFVADLGGLMQGVGAEDGVEAFDVRLGVEFEANVRPDMQFWSVDNNNLPYDTGVRVHRVAPIRATITMGDDLDRQIADLALDLVNQGGVSALRVLPNPDGEA